LVFTPLQPCKYLGEYSLALLASKAQELFDSVTDKIVSGSKYSEFEFARLCAEANKLDSYTKKHEVLGWGFAVQGSREQALEHYERALKSSHADFYTSANFYSLLKYECRYIKAIEVGNELANGSNVPSFLNDIFIEQIIHLNFDSAKELQVRLDKMNVFDDRETARNAKIEMDLVFSMIAADLPIDIDSLKLIGKVALEVASEFNCRLMGNKISQLKESEHLSIQYVISDKLYSSEFAHDLNTKFIDRLVDDGLDDLSIIVQFIRVDFELDTNINRLRIS
jgi:tetratricopeptide (TPR) repeat protein